MATDVHNSTDHSVTALVGGIIDDAQELFQQQVALVRAEVRSDFQKTKEATAAVSLGAGVCLLAAILLCLMVVHLLTWAFPQLPPWGSYGIVGTAAAVIGGIMLVAGIQKFRSFNPLPDESANALQENLQWKTNSR